MSVFCAECFGVILTVVRLCSVCSQGGANAATAAS